MPKSKSLNSPNLPKKSNLPPNKKSSKRWSTTLKHTPVAANLSFAKNLSRPTTIWSWPLTWFTPSSKVLLTWWTFLTRRNKINCRFLKAKIHPNKAKIKKRKFSHKNILPITRSRSKPTNWLTKYMTSRKSKSVGLNLKNYLTKSPKS